jgi:hypothetical protein
VKNPFKSIGSWFKSIFKYEMPDIGINEGDTVVYLGVDWKVTTRYYSSAEWCDYVISRINKLDQLERVSLPYYSTAAKLKESKP